MSTSGARGPGSRHIDVAAAHADLGLPVPPETRFRRSKRALGRVVWIFGRHQAEYNHAMLAAVSELANAVETIRTSIPEQVGNDIGGMRSQVGALEVDVHRARGELKATASHLEELQTRVDELARRLGAVDVPTPPTGTTPRG